MSSDRFLIWDFDGTLAVRPGNWTGVVCDVVAVQRPDAGITPERLRPHLQSGFPWHAPDVVRQPCSADQWWSELLPVLARAVQSATGVEAPEARRLVTEVRAAYTDAKSWQGFDDVWPALARLRDRGWRHIVLSNHVPELPQLVEALGLRGFITAVTAPPARAWRSPIGRRSRRGSPGIPKRRAVG
jgi:putative hydrolase of the HAD superfamily